MSINYEKEPIGTGAQRDNGTDQGPYSHCLLVREKGDKIKKANAWTRWLQTVININNENERKGVVPGSSPEWIQEFQAGVESGLGKDYLIRNIKGIRKKE